MYLYLTPVLEMNWDRGRCIELRLINSIHHSPNSASQARSAIDTFIFEFRRNTESLVQLWIDSSCYRIETVLKISPKSGSGNKSLMSNQGSIVPPSGSHPEAANYPAIKSNDGMFREQSHQVALSSSNY
ncbi:hypothetical protein DSO57_1014073 [Entomophthora muscae]|uniref:Uncharacterized protein n=1 Tax=Entomophthora muscae TaxID=34485 RepID=A0ACC2TG99_9FUNG|nr:hypothetical protein DSO57_1014073 [Entomophthora muscae]